MGLCHHHSRICDFMATQGQKTRGETKENIRGTVAVAAVVVVG